MDDIQVILYILFGIIYFIFRVLKNKQETKDQPQYDENKADELGKTHEEVRHTQSRPQKPRPGTSLEDILRELSGEFYEEEKQPATPKREPEFKPVQERRETREMPYQEPRKPVFKEEASSYERAGSEMYRKYETTNYDEVKKKGRKKGEKKYKTLDEQVDIDSFEVSVKPQLQELEGDTPKSKVAMHYARVLRNPDEMKKAIIYSEIIKRKYE